jgi:hypothetical protein
MELSLSHSGSDRTGVHAVHALGDVKRVAYVGVWGSIDIVPRTFDRMLVAS